MPSTQIKYHFQLAQYFARKPIYSDVAKRKFNIRKLIELPWQYYNLKESSSLLTFIKEFDVFREVLKHNDYPLYENYLVKNSIQNERIKSIWLLFGLHIGNGEDFVSASGLIKKALPFVAKDFGEASKEFVKALYFLGWCRNKMDDLIDASFYFSKAKHLIIEFKIEECNEYLKWIERESCT